MLMGNVGPTGSLNNDGLLRALLQARNTPDPDCNISPAQVVFGRPIRDAFSFTSRCIKCNNPSIRPTWREAWSQKEDAMRTRMPRSTEALDLHARSLAPLSLGDKVFLQNQRGSHPKKWDKSGTVVELGNYDQYWVKVDGSGRLTLRNRRFSRKFVPPSLTIGDPLSHSHQPYGLATRDSLRQTRSESPQMTTSLPQYRTTAERRVINTDQTIASALGTTHRCSVRASPRLDRGGADRRSASIVIHPTSYTG